MAINFPNNPAVNDTFTVGGTKFTFTGVKWETGAVVEISSDTTPSLGGTLDAGTHNINNVGVITATTFSGNLIGNVTGTATTATYAQTAGISTYATTAGIATNAQGLTGDPSIQVTNATVLGNLDVQGTTTTIDTAVTSVDSLAVDGAGTFGGVVEIGGDANNGTAEGIELNTSGFLQLSRSGNSALIAGYTQGSSTQTVRIKNNGSANFGQASNSTGNNGVAVGGNNGSLNIYTDRYATDCFQILNTTGSGTNIALQAFGNGNLSLAGTISDSIGSLRRLGIQGASGSFALAADHAGKLVRSTGNGSTLTIPQNVFSAGDMISIFNVSTGDNTIAQGTGATLYNTADGATGNRTLGPKGVCTILCTSTNEFIISGSQIS